MARPNDTRMPGKKFGSDAGGGEVKSRHRGERVAGRAESSGRDETWSSAAVSGGERAILGPADCPEDPKKSPV